MQSSRTRTIELLAPVGSIEALDAAIGEGADAVYLGLKNFNARLRTSNFAYSQFEAAVKSLHRQDRRVYVTVNTVFEQREADRMYQLLKYLAGVGPDGLIVQDFGVAAMVNECFPSLKLHASTQMNVASAKAANVLSKQGFSRVVLARELNLDEVRGVREHSSVELEVFVHGALCVSASGLCLFSSYLGGKSANRGMCTQACRRRYQVGRAGDEVSEEAKGFDYSDVAEAASAPENGASGYFFSPSDLQLLEKVPDLADLGVASLKIEGRMKSADYVGTVVSAYRRLLDGLDGDRETALAEAKAILQNDFARPKTHFYYDNATPADWLDPRQAGGTGIPLGPVKKIRQGGEDRQGLVRPEGVLPSVGDSARIHRSDDSERKAVKLSAVEADKSGGFWIPVPEPFREGDFVYLTQTRTMSRRYQPVLPHDLSTFRRLPGRGQAPDLVFPRLEKADLEGFPEGLYVSVGRVEDLYVVQSVRPVRVLLAYTRTAARRLVDGEPLPFSKNEIVIVLDPYYPQGEDARLSEEIPVLLEAGYRNFVVNNLGHLALFRGTEARLVAGPWLYTFNSWAYSFVNGLGLSKLVTPLENNRQNLDRTVAPERRAGTFVTVFAWPSLFRIRADLSPLYPFQWFSDARGESFRLVAGRDGSLVIPEKPFSIVDKIPFLKDAGFSRFIIDFTAGALKKKDYKDVMDAAKAGTPLLHTTRFNWKDGFFAPPDEVAAGRARSAASGDEGDFRPAKYSRPSGDPSSRSPSPGGAHFDRSSRGGSPRGGSSRGPRGGKPRRP